MPDASVSIGADASELRKELAAAAQQAEASGHRIGAGFENGAIGGDHLLASSHRVARQMTNVAQSLVSGGSAADVFAAGLEAVERSLHLSLGALAGLGVAALVVEEFGKAHEEVEKFKMQLQEVFSDKHGTDFSTLNELQSHLDVLDKKLTEIRAKRGSWMEFFTRSGMENREQEAQTQQQKREQLSQIGDKMALQAEVPKIKFETGDIAAEKEKALQDYKEKVGDAFLKFAKIGGEGFDKVQAALQSEYVTVTREIAQKEAGQKRALTLENSILEIKKAGLNVEMLIAQAKAKAAQSEVEFASEELKPKKQAEADDAKFAADQAKKEADLKNEQLDLAQKIAQVQGNELEKRQQILALEKQSIENQLNTPGLTDVEKKSLNVEKSKNDASQRQFQKDQAQAIIAAAEKWEEATAGRGSQARLKVIDAQIKATNQLIDLNKNSAEHDDQYLAEQSTRLNELQKQREDIVFADRQSLAAAKSKTVEMGLQVSGQTVQAQREAIRASYEAQILQAYRDQNVELADQLTKQQKIANLELQINEFLKTPAQKAAEAQNQRDRERARRTIEARNRDKEDHDRRVAESDPNSQGGSLGNVAMNPDSPSGTDWGSSFGPKSKVGPSGTAQYGPTLPPGLTGAKDAAQQLSQMTVQHMTVQTLTVTNFNVTNE